MKKILLTLALILLLAPNAYAQQHCQADFDCNGDVFPSDLMIFLAEYGNTDCTSCSSQSTPCEGTLSPLGRWCDQGNGTVKDMTNGLVWLQKADWGGLYPLWADYGDPDAHHRAAQLWDGSPYEGTAGLSDGSVEGDWRLPTKNELVGITVGDEYIRSSQMYFFTGVQALNYWSGTSSAEGPNHAWVVIMVNGYAGYDNKNNNHYVWPVRSDN